VYVEDSGKLYALAPPPVLAIVGSVRATATKIGGAAPKSAPGNSENTRALRTYAGE
jgi:hypothetical protein